MVELAEKRETAEWIQEMHPEISQRRAAQLVQIPRSTLRAGAPRRGAALREEVREAALAHPRYGHRRLAQMLSRKREGRKVSRRHVQRIIQGLGMQVRTRRRRKWVARPAPAQTPVEKADQRWAMDFVEDWCVGAKRKVRILTVVDCCTREAIVLKAGYSMPARQVVRALELLREAGRKPAELRLDNGPEFISHLLVNWCKLHEVRLSHIERGKPQQNGYGESFNGRLRDECLNGHYFEDENDTQEKIDVWRGEYLFVRPHGSLKGKTPAQVAQEQGVRTPFAFPIFDKAKAPPCQGDPLRGRAPLGLDTAATLAF